MNLETILTNFGGEIGRISLLLEALKRTLINKKLITNEEFELMVKDILEEIKEKEAKPKIIIPQPQGHA